jgi:hypothetical protein
MNLIVWESYFDREYLINQFNKDGTPDPMCPVHRRKQGAPQKHMLTLVKDGVEILSKVKGKCLETGLYNLPCQRYNMQCNDGFLVMGEKEMMSRKPSESLPKTVKMQYQNVLVTWQAYPFVAMRDYGPHKRSVYVYSPAKIEYITDTMVV